jgi:RsiW-degrading membrane proteinase PrsW (M82 family)
MKNNTKALKLIPFALLGIYLFLFELIFTETNWNTRFLYLFIAISISISTLFYLKRQGEVKNAKVYVLLPISLLTTLSISAYFFSEAGLF